MTGQETARPSVDTRVEPGGARAVARCDLLGEWPYGDSRDHLFRPFLGSGHKATGETILAWMRDAGMTVRIDPAGNLLGRYEGHEPDAPALLIGSHVDSVKDAGRYDGMLGVMLGIEVVEVFYRAGRRFDFAIEVIGFGDEEGSRFPSYMLGSRAVAGVLPENALETVDADGLGLRDALRAWGLDPGRFAQAHRAPDEILAYLEAHIEQAPFLDQKDLPLGVVSHIAAQSRFYVTVTGVATHAGTAMGTRRDALAAAAEMVLAIEEIASEGPVDLVATVGSLTLPSGGATNIVSGSVVFSIDLRAAEYETRDRAACAVQDALAAIAVRRGVSHSIEEVHRLAGARCDARLNSLLQDAIRDVAGYCAPVMVSQAGHDGMNIAALVPIAMLFIRCKDGISHNPAESVLDGDVERALAAMVRFIETLERQSS